MVRKSLEVKKLKQKKYLKFLDKYIRKPMSTLYQNCILLSDIYNYSNFYKGLLKSRTLIFEPILLVLKKAKVLHQYV